MFSVCFYCNIIMQKKFFEELRITLLRWNMVLTTWKETEERLHWTSYTEVVLCLRRESILESLIHSHQFNLKYQLCIGWDSGLNIVKATDMMCITYVIRLHKDPIININRGLIIKDTLSQAVPFSRTPIQVRSLIEPFHLYSSSSDLHPTARKTRVTHSHVNLVLHMLISAVYYLPLWWLFPSRPWSSEALTVSFSLQLWQQN